MRSIASRDTMRDGSEEASCGTAPIGRLAGLRRGYCGQAFLGVRRRLSLRSVDEMETGAGISIARLRGASFNGGWGERHSGPML